MSIIGWYYLHENGSLIYKREIGGTAADIRESDLARGLWPLDPQDRAGKGSRKRGLSSARAGVHKPTTRKIMAALGFLDILEEQLKRTYRDKDVSDLCAYACDFACGTLDQLNNMHAGFLREADEAGIAHDMLAFDLLELQLAGSLWKARAEARERAVA
jgi:hypothetical protein